MSSRLDNSPSEIVEGIVRCLDLNDICNLRLSSRILSTKATQDYFKSFFCSKHVDITENSLREFVFVTAFDRLGSLIRHLILGGVVYDTTFLEAEVKRSSREKRSKAQYDLGTLKQRHGDHQQFLKSGKAITLLGEALSNIRGREQKANLRSLSLEVVVYQQDDYQRSIPLTVRDWKDIWHSTASTFHTTMHALAASGLQLDSFNIFNNRQLQSCSMASNELASIDFQNEGLIVALACLKSLSLSLSNPVSLGSDLDTIRAAAADESDFEGFPKLLKLCSQLESLELHHYFLGRSPVTRNDELHGRMLQRASEMDVAPLTVRRLELRGFWVTEAGLLGLIRAFPVRHLTMYDIHIYVGTFRSIFDYCTSTCANMHRLYFNSLSEEYSIIAFYEPGLLGSSDVLQRVGTAVRRPVMYQHKLPSEDSPSLRAHRAWRAREYGPYWFAKKLNEIPSLS